LFRILQEAVHNAAKYSHQQTFRVAVREVGGALHLSISDNGIGFDVQAAQKSGFGIRNTATIGIISSAAVQLDPDTTTVYIETDAALNPGDSGGALVDTDGHLVGINTAALNGQRVGLSIPSDTVKFVCDQLRRFGRVVPVEI
jgi:S1-C subfamily serine protease